MSVMATSTSRSWADSSVSIASPRAPNSSPVSASCCGFEARSAAADLDGRLEQRELVGPGGEAAVAAEAVELGEHGDEGVVGGLVGEVVEVASAHLGEAGAATVDTTKRAPFKSSSCRSPIAASRPGLSGRRPASQSWESAPKGEVSGARGVATVARETVLDQDRGRVGVGSGVIRRRLAPRCAPPAPRDSRGRQAPASRGEASCLLKPAPRRRRARQATDGSGSR